jgi:hypothetical protein
MPQFNDPSPKFRDISRELWDKSSSFCLTFHGKNIASRREIELSAGIKSGEEIQHPGSHIMHASIVWLVTSWEERPPIDGLHVYWLRAISVASIADVVALLGDVQISQPPRFFFPPPLPVV